MAATKRTRLVMAIVLIGALISGVIGVGIASTAEPALDTTLPATGVALGDPQASLKDAEEVTPYRLRKPSWLPEGTQLVHVDWVIADPAETGSVVNVDMWYATLGGHSLHVWQTNSAMLVGTPNDPANEEIATPQVIGGRLWLEQRITFGNRQVLQIGRRSLDGVTVSVDGDLGLGLEALRRIAGSMS